MLYVEVWGLDRDANAEMTGTIAWDGRRYILTPPDSLMLQRMLQAKVPPMGGEPAVGSDRPEQWLEELHLQFHGSRQWVSKVKKTTPAGASRR
jgi:hypothetical protein